MRTGAILPFAIAAGLIAPLSLWSLKGSEFLDAAASGETNRLANFLAADPSLVSQTDTNRATALHYAARNGRKEAVDLLLTAGADLEARNNQLHSPLYCALHSGQAETAAILLGRGAQFSTPDQAGRTAVHLATEGGTNTVRLLLEKGAPVDSLHLTNRMTPLHGAAAMGRVDVAVLLMDHDANVNASDSEGDTPLHWAAAKGRFECALLLLKRGADPNALDRMGFKPLDLVHGKENDPLARLLEEKTATRWESTGKGIVGEMGDASRLVFSGNTTFSTEQIREALRTSASYLLAAHPQAGMAAFLELLQQKVQGGYQAGGFPNPQVKASYDERTSCVRVTIEEGRQFRCGQVLVVGAGNRAVTQTIIERLRQGYKSTSQGAPREEMDMMSILARIESEAEQANRAKASPSNPHPGEDPLWKPGAPARFDPAGLDVARLIARVCLAEAGYWFPKLEVRTRPLPGRSTADLEIQVHELGPPGTLVDIQVAGNEKNTRAEILNYLGLRSGKLVTHELLQGVDRRLWDSGRFMDWTLMPEPVSGPDNPKGGLRLRLDVRENDNVPKLTSKLTREESTLLGCAHKLAEFPKGSEDLVVRVAGAEDFLPGLAGGNAFLSPKDGLLLELGTGKSNALQYAFLISRQLIGFYRPNRSGKYEAKDPAVRTTGLVHLVPNAPGDSNRWNFSIGAGVRSRTDEEPGPCPAFELDLTLAPAYFLSLAAEQRDASKWEGKTLVIDSPQASLRVDSRTGRIQEWVLRSSPRTEVLLTRGAFLKRRAELEAANRSAPNRYEPGHGFTSFMAFAGGELLRWMIPTHLATNQPLDQASRAAEAVNKLLGDEIFAPFDRPALANWQEAFTLPVDEVDMALAKNNLAAMYSGIVFQYCDEMFPKYSWPWTLARESVFVLASQGRYVGAELQRLAESEHTGPIGSLVISRVLTYLDEKTSRQFALRGLTRMSADDFMADCKLFLSGGGGLAQSFRRIAERLNSLPDDELQALCSVLPSPEGTLMKKCAAAMHSDPDQPLTMALGPALREYWTTALRQQVREELQKLVAPKLEKSHVIMPGKRAAGAEGPA